MRTLRCMADRLLRHDKWSVGLLSLTPAQLVRGEVPEEVQWLDPRPGQYMADPFLFCHDGRQFLFYELFIYGQGRGSIAVAELVRDGTGRLRLQDERFILEAPFHQSYPFVFAHGEDIFCLPEQAEAGCLMLYRATDFPSEWSLDTVLIEDFPVIDPTLFRHDGRWWLLATRLGQQDSHLYCWHSNELHGPWQPHAGNPVKAGVGSVRPAGPVFTVDGHLYRPVQAFARRYGDGGIRIEKIVTLDRERLAEETVITVKPFRSHPQGLHHVCMDENGAVVDGNRYAGPVEVCLKLVGILRRKLAGKV